MRIGEGREAQTGEGKVLTIGLVSFPFSTRCHHHCHHGDGDAFDTDGDSDVDGDVTMVRIW